MRTGSEGTRLAESRYEEIARDLIGRIASGGWQVGGFLPSEPDLAAEYKVSRETLRRALREVEAAGLISRRQGQGTLVKRLRPERRFSSRMSTMDELASYGSSAARSFLSVEDVVMTEELAQRTGLPAGSTQTCLTTLRRDPSDRDQPLSWARVYLAPSDWELIAESVQGSDRLIADLVSEHTGRSVDRVVQRLRAVAMPAAAAEVLGVPEGSVGLEITRQYLDAVGRIVEAVVSVHPGETFTYETVLERR